MLLAGCRQDMHDHSRFRPLEYTTFFDDHRSSRLLVPGTVPRGYLQDQPLFDTGMAGNQPVATLPVPVTEQLLRRGQERYNIFCSPCHDRLGSGLGMIVRRGYRRPPSFHTDRLREAPVGHIFDVVTNGFGAMPDYSAQIPPADRWAIAAYIRVLQFSQNAPLNALPPDVAAEVREKLPQ